MEVVRQESAQRYAVYYLAVSAPYARALMHSRVERAVDAGYA